MSVGILVLSHDGSCAQLLRQLSAGTDELAINIMALMINTEMTTEVLQPHLEQRLEQLDTGAGVLMLCDHTGDALSGAISTLAPRYLLKVITGLNYAMLAQALAHPDDELDTLAGFALHGGRQGIQLLATAVPE